MCEGLRLRMFNTDCESCAAALMCGVGSSVCTRVYGWEAARDGLATRASCTAPHVMTARVACPSPLASCLLQIGSDCPDVKPAQLKAAWEAVQSLVKQGLVSAGHDISDGGIATTLLEMAFAGEQHGTATGRSAVVKWHTWYAISETVADFWSAGATVPLLSIRC